MASSRKSSLVKTRVKIGVHGCTGRMGRLIVGLLENDLDWQTRCLLSFGASGPHDPRYRELSSGHTQVDVMIDFSAPKSSLELAKLCAKKNIPTLICTTGFSADEKNTLQKILARSNAAWALIPNTSLGVHITHQALKTIGASLTKDSQIALVETHHRHKKDAPSGTALALLETLRKTLPQASIDVHSLRGGSEPGEHTVVFMMNGETIELTHRATDRGVFAHGALRLACSLASKKKRATPYLVEELLIQG